ncbi:hypothetical protein MFM001_19380 [Mycobacterium sp. MFM001]|uniref:HepT-like ribonuclease domain-containing protein n=1 Tax=Mycobacterium sp. MFM001 TaxID=2049453 RepID=UPI000DA5BB2B|nr:HepT-like ribonuclease domain-containing protein [Mycobacterium sp. MFM001]GBE65476.1 hypothetical protein MFM001_19380 [Mycobacterium sp. MFM001]
MPSRTGRDYLVDKYGDRLVDRLDDLCEFCGEAAELVADGRERLLTQWRQQRAAEAVLGRIGETASRLPSEFREEYPAAPWQQIIGVRIITDHKYRALDYQQVWISLTQAAVLKRYVEEILG